ncbi:protein PhaF [Salinibacter sp. 10B]|uniref:phasin family protein n=1 Tax=Salinibacter sp. 10B TaxID=1923971 RepID=UPI000CF3D70D|nr:phasin family protein [Salinibacter sp. 10B]PQJ34598.1 protein PhaF [Salinibacter sp. 10B]
MTAQSKKPNDRTDTLQDELTQRGRDVWLAGLGALATVEEEGNKLYNRLVERGKEFEEERRKELKEAEEEVREKGDKALTQLEEAGEETQSLLLDTVNSALERFGVPTRSEVDRLSEKVETLSKQVDELSSTLSDRNAQTDGKK